MTSSPIDVTNELPKIPSPEQENPANTNTSTNTNATNPPPTPVPIVSSPTPAPSGETPPPNQPSTSVSWLKWVGIAVAVAVGGFIFISFAYGAFSAISYERKGRKFLKEVEVYRLNKLDMFEQEHIKREQEKRKREEEKEKQSFRKREQSKTNYKFLDYDTDLQKMKEKEEMEKKKENEGMKKKKEKEGMKKYEEDEFDRQRNQQIKQEKEREKKLENIIKQYKTNPQGATLTVKQTITKPDLEAMGFNTVDDVLGYIYRKNNTNIYIYTRLCMFVIICLGNVYPDFYGTYKLPKKFLIETYINSDPDATKIRVGPDKMEVLIPSVHFELEYNGTQFAEYICKESGKKDIVKQIVEGLVKNKDKIRPIIELLVDQNRGLPKDIVAADRIKWYMWPYQLTKDQRIAVADFLKNNKTDEQLLSYFIETVFYVKRCQRLS
jgi:hypothetical protein